MTLKEEKNMIDKDVLSCLSGKKIRVWPKKLRFLEIAAFSWNIFWWKKWRKISRWQCSLWGIYCKMLLFLLMFFVNQWANSNQVFSILKQVLSENFNVIKDRTQCFSGKCFLIFLFLLKRSFLGIFSFFEMLIGSA